MVKLSFDNQIMSIDCVGKLGRLFFFSPTLPLKLLIGLSTTSCIRVGAKKKKKKKEMAPKCDMVIEKLLSSGLIYFYLTPNISAVPLRLPGTYAAKIDENQTPLAR